MESLAGEAADRDMMHAVEASVSPETEAFAAFAAQVGRVPDQVQILTLIMPSNPACHWRASVLEPRRQAPAVN